MAAVSIEMCSLMETDSRSEQIDEARLYIQDLPSRVARHTTSTVMRNQVTTRRKSRGGRGTSVKRSGALKRQGKRVVTSSTAWSSDDQEPTAGPISSIDEEVLENVDFKAVPLPMSLRRRYKQSLRARAPRRVSGWKVFILNLAMGWKHFQTGLKECIYSLELWRGHLKDIEGQFGSGVVSYFVFLRWLMFLNLFVFLIEFGFVSLPTLLICTDAGSDSEINVTSCKYEVSYAANNGSDKWTGNSFSTMVLDFITGQGWISNTIMFYSSYPSDAIVSQEGVRYHLPLAYLLTGGAYFIFCLAIMIHSASIGLKESYINSEGVFNSSCNRLFSAWDYCISEKSAAMHKKQMIVQDIRFELEEEARLLRVLKRSRKQKMVLYGTRIVINLFIVPALWYVSFVLVVGVIIGKKVTEEGRGKVEQMLIRSSLSLAITIPNLILPPLFEFLSMFEDWGPKFELGLNLLRRILIKLPSVAVLMILLYKDLNDRIQDSESLSSHCQQCWENEIAAQMYMLVWVDFFVVFLITLGLETLRKFLCKKCRCFREKVGIAEFDISRNVIDLAYGQCLILMGTFFSPILPIIGVLKMIVFFYIKKVSLFYNNRLPDKPVQGARLSSIFALLLLLTFFMCIGLVGWGVTRVPTSFCGPFKNMECDANNFIIDELSSTVSSWPGWIHKTLRFMRSAAFLLPVLVLVISLVFYYRSMTQEHSRVISKLKYHLVLEGKAKKLLLLKLLSSREENKTEEQESVKYNEDDILLMSLAF